MSNAVADAVAEAVSNAVAEAILDTAFAKPPMPKRPPEPVLTKVEYEAAYGFDMPSFRECIDGRKIIAPTIETRTLATYKISITELGLATMDNSSIQAMVDDYGRRLFGPNGLRKIEWVPRSFDGRYDLELTGYLPPGRPTPNAPMFEKVGEEQVPGGWPPNEPMASVLEDGGVREVGQMPRGDWTVDMLPRQAADPRHWRCSVCGTRDLRMPCIPGAYF